MAGAPRGEEPELGEVGAAEEAEAEAEEGPGPPARPGMAAAARGRPRPGRGAGGSPAAPREPGRGGVAGAARARPKRGENPFAPLDERTELEKKVDRSYPQSAGLWDPEKGATTGRFSDKPAKAGAKEVWNTNWRKDLRKWENRREQERRPAAPQAAETGFLSFKRLDDLNDLSQDFTEELRQPAPKKPRADNPARRNNAPPVLAPAAPAGGGGGRVSERQAKRWERSGRFTAKGVRDTQDAIELQRKVGPTGTAEDLAEVQAQAAAEYARIKQELLGYTLAAGAVGTGACYASYGEGLGISFGVGAVASLIYVRLLSRSTDALASEDAGAQIGGVAGSPRLLIPILLVLIFNKYHVKIEQEYGVDLNVLGLLAGFFVNKVASIAQVVGAAVKETAGGGGER